LYTEKFSEAYKISVQLEYIPFSYREIDYEEVSKGEIIGDGASGIVMKTQWRGKTVAVKKYNVPMTMEFVDDSWLIDFKTEAIILR